MKYIVLHYCSTTGQEYATETYPIEEIVSVSPSHEDPEDKVRVEFLGGEGTKFDELYGDLKTLILECSYISFID